MVDDRLDEEPGRPKRPPPTLELSANEAPPEAASDPVTPDAESSHRPNLVAPIGAGAFAGALVAGLAWFAASTWLTATPEPQLATVADINAARFDDLGMRLAKIENRPVPAAPAAVDLAPLTARLDALDKAAAALREENAALRAQAEKALSAASESPKDASAPPAAPDLSPLINHIAQVEASMQNQIAKLAEQSRKPADELTTRRIAAASLLDAQVRAGEPFVQALDAAKSLAPDAIRLVPLQPFAASGVPSAATLARALLDMPGVNPPPIATAGGLIDRIRSGAAKLVKIERTDALSGDNAIFVRAADAARRDDLASAVRELTALPAADRTAFQPWLERVASRDAARAASRQFANDALAALTKSESRATQ